MSATKAKGKRRFLWIDDEYPSLPWLFSQLRLLVGDNNLDAVRTWEEAEEKFSSDRTRFYCVLLDIMLPRNSKELADEQVRLDEGIVMLQRIKAGEFPSVPRGTPIVIFTARGNGVALERIQLLLDPVNDKLLRKALDSIDDVLGSVKSALQKD